MTWRCNECDVENADGVTRCSNCNAEYLKRNPETCKKCEHIKTGIEIHKEIVDDYDLDKCKQKWVSLSWLKEQIKNREMESESCNCLDWVLSLLEEK